MKKGIVLLCILIGFSSLLILSKNKSRDVGVQVDTQSVSKSSINDTILASGNLQFSREIQIRSELTGIVQHVHVKEGQLVKKGEILIEIDPKSFLADVRKAKAAVEIQLIEIERLKEIESETARRAKQHIGLVAKGLMDKDTSAQLQSQLRIAQIDVLAAQQGLEQYRATMVQSQNRLDKTRFVAAIDGLISTVDIKVGETVIAGTTNIVGSPLMTLADTKSYVAQIRVDEADVANIAIGQDVEVFLAATPRQAVLGKIDSISTSAKNDGINKGLYYKVEVTLDAEQMVYPGMSCRAEILLARSDRELTVPVAAINRDEEGYFVWIVEANKATKKSVKLGMSTDTEQVILSGVVQNDLVITGPSRLVSSLEEGREVQHKESYHAAI
ncbi:efflux RND transporter periplasmic adaptor subunit [Shewanella sp. HL-SH5]|uniref:efflux RND transporter periplasmic adaptor subunit n=1 Tax=unclassified Shewanella TaxID=196818 RepID=UPI003EB8F1F8